MGKGWQLDLDALRQWVFDNWAFLESTMQHRLLLCEDSPLVIVKLDGVFSYNTRRFSFPHLQLYTGLKDPRGHSGYRVEYAVFSINENQELSHLVKNRIIDRSRRLEFSRSELAGLFEPRTRENSSS